MSTEKFQLFADHAALDFVNTLDYRGTPERTTELLGTYEDLLRFSEQAGILTNAEVRILSRNTSGAKGKRVLREAVGLRETFGRICYDVVEKKTPDSGDLKAFNAFLKSAARHHVIEIENGEPTWTWDERENPMTPVWRLALRGCELLTSAGISRIRVCESEACRWLFWDKSKNRTRRWCNMQACGNREKARRFYRRHMEG